MTKWRAIAFVVADWICVGIHVCVAKLAPKLVAQSLPIFSVSSLRVSRLLWGIAAYPSGGSFIAHVDRYPCPFPIVCHFNCLPIRIVNLSNVGEPSKGVLPH